jgi:pyruvate formate lyase activating enzyme
MGFWLEIVTLLVPGFNDSSEEIERLTGFLAGVSPEIPWHVTAFHKDYKMTDPDNTRPDDLMRAAEIGTKAGLHFVYAGNLPGMVGDLENTYCANCRECLVKRNGYHILAYKVTSNGRCPSCRQSVPGRWADVYRPQIADHPFVPLRRDTRQGRV